MNLLHASLSRNSQSVKHFHELVELKRVVLREPQLTFYSLLDILGHLEGSRVKIDLVLLHIILFCSLKVCIVGVFKALCNFFLASNLCMNLKLVSTAVIAIDRLSGVPIAKEVRNGLPLLAFDVQFVLHGVGVHDVCEYGQFFIFV